MIKRSIAALLLSLATSAHAGVHCRIVKPADPGQPRRFDQTIFTTDLPEESGPQTTRFAFVKDGVVDEALSRDEFYARKDFRALDGATYFTFQHSAPGEYLISVGRVNGKIEGGDAAELASYAAGGLGPRGLSLLTYTPPLLGACSAK